MPVYNAKATIVTYCYMYLEGKEIERKDLITVDLKTLKGRPKLDNFHCSVVQLFH